MTCHKKKRDRRHSRTRITVYDVKFQAPFDHSLFFQRKIRIPNRRIASLLECTLDAHESMAIIHQRVTFYVFLATIVHPPHPTRPTYDPRKAILKFLITSAL